MNERMAFAVGPRLGACVDPFVRNRGGPGDIPPPLAPTPFREWPVGQWRKGLGVYMAPHARPPGRP